MTNLNDVRSTKSKNFHEEDEDDDEDSLGSVLSDYNAVFYDAPTISIDLNNKENLKEMTITNTKKITNETSIDSLFDDSSKTDEDTQSIEDNEEFNNNGLSKNSEQKEENDNDEEDKVLNKNDDCLGKNKKKTFSHNNVYIPVENNENSENENDDKNDLDIEKEFEDYLNDENDDENNDNFYINKLNSGSNSSLNQQENENHKLKYIKLKKLENLEYTVENYELFRQMGIEKYGFINKKYRRKAWPLLILHKNKSKEDLNTNINTSKIITKKRIRKNKYFNQVTLDVVRTLKRFPPEISDKLRLKLQNQLIDLICRILIKYENLHYYQGYHDICLTFLLVAGVENSLPMLEEITISHLTCFMETTMESTLKLLFNIMPLIDKKNSLVSEHIQKAELGVIFCLSWLITWYSHVMDNLKIILRLYDLFISTDPLMPIYLGAIIVNEHSTEILSIECDMAALHTVISKYPTKINDIEVLEKHILDAISLYQQYPPETLPDLNLKWLEKCQRIQEEVLKQQQAEQDKLRNRKNKKIQNNDQDDDNNSSDFSDPGNPDTYNINTNIKLRNKISKRNNKKININNRLIKANNGKHLANRLLVGLTFSVGVAAVAMYALNVRDSPQEFISKVYQFLPYKMF